MRRSCLASKKSVKEETSEVRRFVGTPSVDVGDGGRTGSGCHSTIALKRFFTLVSSLSGGVLNG